MEFQMNAYSSTGSGSSDKDVEFGTLAEQLDESHYDSRCVRSSSLDEVDAEEFEKGRIRFPPSHQLYGRQHELQLLADVYHEHSCSSCSNNSNKGNMTCSSQVVFLSGYSGTGKSALIETFVQQQQQQSKSAHYQSAAQAATAQAAATYTPQAPGRLSPLYMSGKFTGPVHANLPFSALKQALNQFALQLVVQLEEEDDSHNPEQGQQKLWILSLVQHLSEVDISLGSSDAIVLEETVLPGLPFLLQKAVSASETQNRDGTASAITIKSRQEKQTGVSSSSSSKTSSRQSNNSSSTNVPLMSTATSTNYRPNTTTTSMNMSLIKFAVLNFFRALSTTPADVATRTTTTQPVIFFLDDLQWADAASLHLLQALCLDMALQNIMFILAFRSNEVNDQSDFHTLLWQPVHEVRNGTNANNNNSGKTDSTTEEKLEEEAEHVGEGESKSLTTMTSEATPTTTNLSSSTKSMTLPSSVHSVELFNLSPDSVAEFIADCIDKESDQVSSLVQAVYKTTLGNIFFVKLMLEDLVRRNALYYDTISFEWLFRGDNNSSLAHIESLFSQDVIGMVQSKLQTLPSTLQTALMLAAYTSQTTIDLPLLQTLLLQAKHISLTREELEELLHRAFIEGLVLPASRINNNKGAHEAVTKNDRATTTSYQFSHDRIREAACAMIPPGPQRDQLMLAISKVLLRQVAITQTAGRVDTTGQQQKNDHDWIIFAAARHLNSLPSELILQENEDDSSLLNLPLLNLTVAKIAVSKGAFQDATLFLKEGVSRLDPINCWKDPDYGMTLEMKVILAESEKMLGRIDRALELLEEILNNARCLEDKSSVHQCYIEAINIKNDYNYAETVDTALGILALYSIHVPRSPTKVQVQQEKMLLRLALRGRSLMCLSKYPVATDTLQIAQMKVAFMTMLHAMYGKRTNLYVLIGYRMLRVVLGIKTIARDLPSLLVALGGYLRENRKYEIAFLFGNLAISLMDHHFPGEKGLEFFMAKYGLYASLFCLRVPFRECVEPFLDLSKWGYAQGETENGLASGMLAMYSFMIASLPLNALFEPKLMSFEDMSRSRGRKTFLIIFSLLRQYLYNLQGGRKACPVPSQVNGEAFNEPGAVAMMEGPGRKQNIRDISMVRLQLAVIFDDEMGMQEMLDRLDEYPVHDFTTVRQHLRMTYMGFAALILAQNRNGTPAHSTTSKKHAILHKKWAKLAVELFGELARFGSPNAQPVYACMTALSKRTVAAFDEAIQICGNAGLLNLAAIMNERCGLMLLEGGSKNVTRNGNRTVRSSSSRTRDCHAETYLKCAAWCYHDWGATGKVSQLKSRFECLKNVMHEMAPSRLSSVRQSINLGRHPTCGTTSITNMSNF